MNNKIKSIAIHLYFVFWDFIDKRNLIIKPPVTYYIRKYDFFVRRKTPAEAVKYLIKGFKAYPNDFEINRKLARYYTSVRNWEQALKFWENVFKYGSKVDVSSYRSYVRVLRLLGNYKNAQVIVEKGLRIYPSNVNLHVESLKVSICNYQWKRAVEHYEYLKSTKYEMPIDLQIKGIIGYQVLGQFSKAKTMLNGINKNNQLLKQYTKIILFDNGESRIEFYKQHFNANKVCITFDSINITWDQQPFGFKFLIKEGVDIIAVRRRKDDSYQQDLSLEEFYTTVKPLVDFYYKTIAYGFSLGGYSALYYASNLNCDILALSPRNSIHPVYGTIKEKFNEFNHYLNQKMNENITPVIAYDHKNRIDKNYIQNELKRAYPNGVFLRFPYAGHRIAPFFKQVGILKDIIRRVINGDEIPSYRSINKGKSYQYLRVLGNECLRRNKYRLALSLGIRATELAPNDLQSNRLKIRALVQLKKYNEAIVAAEESLKYFEDDKVIKPILTYLKNKPQEIEKLSDNEISDLLLV